MGKKRAAIITMSFNEGQMLSLWTRHHSKLVGFDALYVLDHGSTDGSTQSNGGNVIRLPRDTFDDHARARSVSALQRALFEYYDTVIYTDTDEFLTIDPEYRSLGEFLEALGDVPVAAGLGIDVIHRPNAEPALDFSKPILRQREYGIFKAPQSKPIIARSPVEWSAGFHATRVAPEVRTDAFLFHLKTADIDLAMARLQLTRSMAWSEAALAIGMGSHQRIEDDVFKLWFFANRETEITQGDLDSFCPEVWADSIRSAFYESKGFVRYEQLNRGAGDLVKSRPFQIPDRLRDLL